MIRDKFNQCAITEDGNGLGESTSLITELGPNHLMHFCEVSINCLSISSKCNSKKNYNNEKSYNNVRRSADNFQKTTFTQFLTISADILTPT